MKYPDYKTYEILYARFLQGDRSEQLLDLAGNIEGKSLIDICCGGGRLTKEALKRGIRKIIAVDSEPSMIPNEIKNNRKIDSYTSGIEYRLLVIPEHYHEKIDIAICQQGINYWLTETLAKNLSLIMKPGGVFIFNTFNEEPSEMPEINKYMADSGCGEQRIYVEVSWRIDDGRWDDVQHIQICEGFPPHFTSFKWMDDEYIRACLEAYFDVELIKDGKTSIYKCVKK